MVYWCSLQARESPTMCHVTIIVIPGLSNLQRIIVNFLKNTVGERRVSTSIGNATNGRLQGRLRPDFLDRCQWNGTQCAGYESF